MHFLLCPTLRTLIRLLPWGIGLVLMALASARPGLTQPLTPGESPDPAAAVALDTSRAADRPNWVVLAMRGSAGWRPQDDPGWRSFQQGQVVPPGSVIETGPDGEVTLVTGGDELLIGPDSRLIVPLSAEAVALRHERGRLLVQVEPRRDRAFQVRTPLLSMGIKGTSFELAVDADQDRVLVLRGEVEVTPSGSSDAIDLRAGEGLAQPAAPEMPAQPFAQPIPPDAWPRYADQPWLIPGAVDPGVPAPGEADDRIAQGQSDVPEESSVSGPWHRAEGRPAASQVAPAEEWQGRDQLLIGVGVAAGALLLVLGPGFSLLQALRARWEHRGSARGRRRRSLIRDA